MTEYLIGRSFSIRHTIGKENAVANDLSRIEETDALVARKITALFRRKNIFSKLS